MILNEIKEQLKKEFENIPLPIFKYGKNIIIKPEEDIEKIFKEQEKENISNFPSIETANEETIKKYFGKIAKKDKFSLFTLSNYNRSAFIHIKESKNINIDLDINKDTHDYIMVLVDKNVETNIIYHLKSKNIKRTVVMEVIALQNSKVKITTIQDLNKEALNFESRGSLVERDAIVEWNDCHIGGGYYQLLSDSKLGDQGSESLQKGIFYTDKNQKYNLDYSSTHKSKNAKSDIFVRGVMNDTSKSLFNGLVKIEKGATNSSGYQKADILLLSGNAEADAIPNLEIDNNDVKCSHGATIGQLNEEKVFYLMARGFSKENAEKTIVEGFFEPIFDKINNEGLVSSLRKRVNNRLGGVN